MANTNTLEGFKCPKCGSLQPFWIDASSVFEVWDDGTAEHQDVQWNDESGCRCWECSHAGSVKDFNKGGKDEMGA